MRKDSNYKRRADILILDPTSNCRELRINLRVNEIRTGRRKEGLQNATSSI